MIKLVAVVAGFLLIRCSHKEGEKSRMNEAFTEAELRSSWVQLMKRDGKWVIFEPCAPDNFNLYWRADTLIIEWGFDATMDVITRITSKGNSYLLEGIDVNSVPPNHRFRVEPVDTMPGLAYWWFNDEPKPRILVKKQLREKYPVVKELCEDMLQEMEDAAKKK